MFIGREKEVKQIHEMLEREEKNAIMIYGARRIGKSTLIWHVIRRFNCKVIYYECLNAPFEENLRNFESRVKSVFNNRFVHFERFEEAFEFIQTYREKTIVVLDEYSYLKNSKPKMYVDSIFQNIIDQLNGDVHVVLLGSFVGIMRELLEEGNPLFGRFNLTMRMQAFDYLDAAGFYPGKTTEEKIKMYAVFGGSPFVLAAIDPGQSVKENIIKQILNPDSAVRTYLENVLLSELSKVTNINAILTYLSNGKKKYKEIENRLDLKTAGVLDKQLKSLLNIDVIAKKNPINKANDRRKIFYEIEDNLLRFYYSYVFANRDIIRTIGEEAFYDLYIEPTLETFVSYRFEEIVQAYFKRQARDGKRRDIYDIGSYWYDNPKEKKNGEFDCVLMHKDAYSFYEVKFHKNPLSLTLCQKEEMQVKEAVGEKAVERIGFVSLSGFNFESEQYDLITADQLYVR